MHRTAARQIVLFALVCLLGLNAPDSAQAQAAPQCGYASEWRFPVGPGEPDGFALVQDYGARSFRAQARFHTGEDWTVLDSGGGAAGSLAYGQPVFAAAAGRVTFASANGWGRDGGVIIIEHTLPNTSVVYSMYGHLTDATGITFPAIFTCVRAGETLAAIGDSRPGPHLHFEIRGSGAAWGQDIPGAGYSYPPPGELGLRRPAKFIRMMQLRTGGLLDWFADLADETAPDAPPVLLGDGGLLLLDNQRVLRLSSDGRVLWRILIGTITPLTPIALLPAGESASLLFTDGSARRVTLDGQLSALSGDQFTLPGLAQGARIARVQGGRTAGDLSALYVQTEDGTLLAYALADGTPALRYQVAGLPPLTARHTAGESTALVVGAAEAAQLFVLDDSGTVIDTAQLQEPAALAGSPNGTLYAYTVGGLWAIAPDGIWTPQVDAQGRLIAGGGARAALAFAPDGRLFTFDGAYLRAYTPDGAWQLLWELPLATPVGGSDLTAPPAPSFAGRQVLEFVAGSSAEDEVLLLLGSAGALRVVQARSGLICGEATLWGSPHTGLWHALDGRTLRVWIGDQVLGLNWSRLLGPCAA
jgi:murein DD-endopeptidase MepM/ murein hydrolase activator NlpD